MGEGGGVETTGFRREADDHFAVEGFVDAAFERALVDGPGGGGGLRGGWGGVRRVEVGEDGGWGEGVAVGRGDCVGAKVWMGHKVVRGEG